MRNLAKTLRHLPRRAAVAAISLYQATISPDHGPLRGLYPYGFCRHHPTCSAYGKSVIGEYGVIVGSGKLLWRLLHCTPWTPPNPERLRCIGEKFPYNP